jgi:hypothetical protein
MAGTDLAALSGVLVPAGKSAIIDLKFFSGDLVMCVEINDRRPRNSVTIATLMGGVLLVLQWMAVSAVQAVEVLSAQELASHCERLGSEPEGVDGQYCIRYIQGFIDGAVATDARVMLNAESDLERDETFTERAKRTRAPSRADQSRAAGLAGFCLGDPLPLREVVDVVVADLAVLPGGEAQDQPALEVVYTSLRKHYPCKL